MNELMKLIEDEIYLDKKIKFYLSKEILKEQPQNSEEILGHLEKAKHNLSFVYDIKELDYPDWLITGCYYSLYHATLALILSKGYSSKNHNATLSVVVKEFYEKGLELPELEILNKFFITSQDLIFYVDAKEKRKDASYSSKFVFEQKELNEMRQKTIEYVEKIKNLLNIN